MKKSTLLFFFIVLAICTQAQTTIIPKVGVTMSNVATDDDEGMESKIGFTLGAGLNFTVTDMFSLQPELNFIQKGFKTKRNDSGDGYEASEEGKISINYLEIPVLAKITFGESTKFFLNAGPSLGIGVGGKFELKQTFTDTDLDETVSATFDGKVKFGDAPASDEANIYFDNRLDVGLQFGAGVLIADKISIEARYGLGLTNLNGEDDGDDNKSQNRVFQFTIGVPLAFK